MNVLNQWVLMYDLWKHLPFLCLWFLCHICFAGVAAAQSHSVSHGGTVAEDRGGECGEDDAV